MKSAVNSYYFTIEDPDYSIKGSRDPLGFQVIWQQQAKALIPHLSTVSIYLRDFQILSLAYFLYGREADLAFVNFFMRFEQLMSYARFDMGDKKFNGILKVSARLMNNSKLSLSTSKNDQTLTNQRAYGIWGKYSRPYRDMGFLKHPEFNSVYSNKIHSLSDKLYIEKLVQRLIEKESSNFNKDELGNLHELLMITEEEMRFYETIILFVEQPLPLQNELYKFLKANGAQNSFSYSLLQSIKSFYPENKLMHAVLKEIAETEKIICPLNRIMRYIQTKPLWTKAQIDSDDYIAQCKIKSDFVFPLNTENNKLKNNFSLSLQNDNWDIIQSLVKRNKEVTSWRGGSPWLSLKENTLEIHHQDGGFYDPVFDPETDNDNDYFINTYIHLFDQIMKVEVV